ncbi:tetratricopeptide repeat protein [Candidatus Chloroploca sp. M-50]|uniref:Tetratricopeptide repeat protein n=1 Tax=Candidatus Chloroploca mongolica TaxID=2528176 RepID=A0ABS4DD53_9CHLR|nr:tetratricopeptide repeat protein [Candidatus Chloroploca mongolica]MBP1467372.1 tetratricopeptide repeat protein [Candidatus Chloroploca mongolica]
MQLSAKDTQLTSSGIVRLHPTLFSLENLIDSILLLFNFGEITESSLDQRKEIATTLLSDYSMLLILDNMETVKDGRIMEFVRSLPPLTKAKVLMTSRLRTTSWELPIPVNELSFPEVKEFLHIKSGEMRLGILPDFENTLKQVHIASGGLPLAIQWMLGQYSITGNLSKVTNQVRSPDSPLLEFSFRNSWAVLPSEAQTALAILSIFDESPTMRLWATALGWSTEAVEKATSKLIEATFVSEKVDPKTGQKTYHALPITLAFARNELAKMDDLELTARTRHQRHVQEMELVAAETERFSSLFVRFKVERDTEKRAVILARKAEDQAASLNYEEAERFFKEAMDIDPRSVYVLVNYGLFKQKTGQVGESIRLMEEASNRCNKDTGFFVYYNLGKVYDEIRNREQVERCLRKALEYQPENFIARHQLGVVTSRLGKFQEADGIFDDLIKDQLSRIYPSDTLIIAYKSKIINLRKSGQYNLAKKTVQVALENARKFAHLAGRLHELDDAYNDS